MIVRLLYCSYLGHVLFLVAYISRFDPALIYKTTLDEILLALLKSGNYVNDTGDGRGALVSIRTS